MTLEPPDSSDDAAGAAPRGRPFVGVHFACCNVYLRVYRAADNQHYFARCPRCGRSIEFVESDTGEESRNFVVR